MGYMVFSFIVNHLISIFLVFYHRLVSDFFPSFVGKLWYKKRYEIAVVLYRPSYRYEKLWPYRPVQYGIDFIAHNTIKLSNGILKKLGNENGQIYV